MQEQAELWMALRDRMKESWTELTLQEKKAGKLPTPRHVQPTFHQLWAHGAASRSSGEALASHLQSIAMNSASSIDG